MLRGEGHIYFEVPTMILVFMSLGRWLDARCQSAANQALDALAGLLPDKVEVVRDGVATTTPRSHVAVGEVVQVGPGECFAIDGVISAGAAFVDQSVLTGESAPQARGVGDEVWSGSLNLDGHLQVTVTAAAGEETISRMLNLMYAARRAKGRYARLADRVVTWFVPAVCLLALLAGGLHGRSAGFDAGLMRSLSVLLIACPCALGLATPLAISLALDRASREQVLFRSGEAVEQLAAIRAVRFDKTGTLTAGEAVLARCVPGDDSTEVHTLQIAAALGAHSRHEYSRAIVLAAAQRRLPTMPLVDIETYPGRGILGKSADTGQAYALGSWQLMRDRGCEPTPVLEALFADSLKAELAVAFVGCEVAVLAGLMFSESLRRGAASAITRCQQLQLDVEVLTGDRPERAAWLAAQLGTTVRGGLSPAEKVAQIVAAHERVGTVAMVGDGLNDAPALAAADVGVALACGVDLARNTAAVCLMSDDPARFPWSVELARSTVHVIRQNLAWSFAYNLIGVGLAIAGWLTPIFAAAAMVLSSAVVVSNSLRLARLPGPLPTEQRGDSSDKRSPTTAPRAHSSFVPMPCPTSY
jgi:heavy metal translocating P-type ATPase